jgi:hypothetical protein
VTEDHPRYRDCCEECRPESVPVDPAKVDRVDASGGERALYQCAAGHRWTTFWNYGDSNYEAA